MKLRQPRGLTRTWKQPLQWKMQDWITKHNRTAHSNFQRSPPRSADYGDHSSAPRTKTEPVAQTRFPPSTLGGIFCEKTQGFVRFQTSTSHLREAIIAICNPCLANHSRTTSTKAANSNMKAAIPMENARLDHQTHWHSAFKLSKISSAQRWLWGPLERATNENRTRRTDKVPPIDAGRHFLRENTGFRAISTFHKSPARSNHCDLQSVPCKSQ